MWLREAPCGRGVPAMTIGADIAALPASGGWIGCYWWTAEEREEVRRAIRAAAFIRRFVVVCINSHHGRDSVFLVPQAAAPVRCVAGMRHAGKAKRRRHRRGAEQTLAALRYRDRLAKTIGWAAAVADPHFQEVLRATSPRWGKKR